RRLLARRRPTPRARHVLRRAVVDARRLAAHGQQAARARRRAAPVAVLVRRRRGGRPRAPRVAREERARARRRPLVDDVGGDVASAHAHRTREGNRPRMNIKLIVPLLMALALGALTAAYDFLEDNNSW